MEEVLGHALLLTSPLAACYGAKLLTRLVEQLEDTRRGFLIPRAFSRCLAAQRRTDDRGANCTEQPHDCGLFQYKNAAFSYQNLAEYADSAVVAFGYAGNAANGDDDEELGFCILTPQQALGALGDHAPQFAKIFLNGSTFVADRSEPGTVLSIDEYADRISLFSRHQSVGGSPCAADCPSGCPGTDPQVTSPSLPPRATTDGGAPNVPMTCHSDLSPFTSYSSCDQTYTTDSAPTISTRSSLELPLPSDSLSSTCAQFDISTNVSVAAPAAAEKDAIEGPYCNSTAPQMCPPAPEVVILGKANACMWRDAAATAAATAATAEPVCDNAPTTPRELTTPRRPTASPLSAGGYCANSAAPSSVDAQLPRRSFDSGVTPRELDFGRAATGPASSGFQSRCGVGNPRSASHGGAVVAHARPAQRRCWVPAGARSMPPPLPSPSPVVARGGSFSSARTSLHLQEGDVTCCRGVASAPHSPPQHVRARPCGLVTPGAAPSSPSACPVGLSKAPALPLPDGATLESAVPPALRYYLERARAAGAHEGDAAVVAGSVAVGSLGGADAGVAADAPAAAGRPGFVRATVEQLNTQRLVCCHDTPFAAAKTSRKTRPLAHRVTACK
ncbi:hypothetical protein PLESTB_000494200 [Pleodorina starrii]|uniref:Uncharacterized protein n=1 Tax=Pleodorina starrii TaxID=330485 RepID=A0A9W6BFR3_9CHLO|nr:hypothetical protein PLESTM_000365700 [Pleodorina starrii]GLC51362.1 hypothetical protein PLESTB_000494200 [Pleodorina starrii]GLC63727.1 hypothetical protein PLESTF_000067700 [Pleodorina starrii]